VLEPPPVEPALVTALLLAWFIAELVFEPSPSLEAFEALELPLAPLTVSDV